MRPGLKEPTENEKDAALEGSYAFSMVVVFYIPG